jgi:hypothetical protein
MHSKMFHHHHKKEYDWMHDTASCFGYPSDSSRTVRKRAWDAAPGRESALITPSRRRTPTLPPPPPLPPRAAGRGAARSGPGRPGRAGPSHPPPPLATCAARRGADRLWSVRPGRAGHHLQTDHCTLCGRGCAHCSRGCGPVEPGLSLARLMGWSAVCTRSPAACCCVGSGFIGSRAVVQRGCGPVEPGLSKHV